MRSFSAKKVAHPKAAWGHGVSPAPRAPGFKRMDLGPVSWRDLNRVVFVAAAAGFFWLRGGRLNPIYTIVGMICTLVGGIPIFEETYKDMSSRRTNWPMFIAAAILGALLVGNIFVGLVVTFFGLLADVIKQIISFRRRRALHGTMQKPRNPHPGQKPSQG